MVYLCRVISKILTNFGNFSEIVGRQRENIYNIIVKQVFVNKAK
jgi:hypothetical protein